MRLYIIRHGDPDYAADALTERGSAEADALADYLVAAKIEPSQAGIIGNYE